MLLLTPVILRCLLALTVLLGPLASLRGRHSLYAGIDARRSPAITLLDGSPLADSWTVIPSVFELGSYAAGNYTATVLSKPVAVSHCTAPHVPPPATHTITVVLVAGTFALTNPSVNVKNDQQVWVEHNGSFSNAVLAVFAALFVGGTFLCGRMQVLGLERKRAALQTKVDTCTRNTLRRAADISATQAQYAHAHAGLVQLEQSVAILVSDLEVTKTSLSQAEVTTHVVDEQSIGLCKFFDTLLEREQVAEESYVQEVAWFGAQYTILNSQRASLQTQQSAEQASTDVETLEQFLEAHKVKLHLSEVREQQQLDAIDNLKQDVERDRVRIIWAKHDQTVEEFETKISGIELTIASANERANTSAVHNSALQAELGDVQEAVSHLQSQNAKALNVADERIDELNAAIETADVETERLQQNNLLIEVELPALEGDADAFEALAAKMEAENDAIEFQLTQDDAEIDLWLGVVTAERDDLLDEQADARKELCNVSKDAEDTRLSTAIAVSTIKASQDDAQRQHLERSATLEHQITSNGTTADALATRFKTLKASLVTREAQYSAWLDELTQAEERCAQDIEDTMFLTREAVFDAQQYESLGIEAIRKQREAEDNAARAVKRADRAQAQSVATEKEMRISRFAFSTQVKDVEAQCASLSKTAEDLKTEGGALDDANSQLAAEIDRQTTTFERKAGILRSRLIDAEAGLHIFDTMQDDIQQRMDAHLNTMQVRREKLQGNIQDYAGMIDAVDEAIAETMREREEEQDAQSAADGQAEALTLLLFSPGSNGAGTPSLSFASSSATSSPTSPMELLRTPKDHEVIFDCSSEELDVEAGILVASKTVKALVPNYVGLGILL